MSNLAMAFAFAFKFEFELVFRCVVSSSSSTRGFLRVEKSVTFRTELKSMSYFRADLLGCLLEEDDDDDDDDDEEEEGLEGGAAAAALAEADADAAFLAFAAARRAATFDLRAAAFPFLVVVVGVTSVLAFLADESASASLGRFISCRIGPRSIT